MEKASLLPLELGLPAWALGTRGSEKGRDEANGPAWVLSSWTWAVCMLGSQQADAGQTPPLELRGPQHCPTRCMGSGQDWSHMETPKAALLRQGRGTLCSLLWQGFLPLLYLFPNLAEDGRFHGGSLSK